MGTVCPAAPVPAGVEPPLLPLLPQPAATTDATASPSAIFMGREKLRAGVVIMGYPPRNSGPDQAPAES